MDSFDEELLKQRLADVEAQSPFGNIQRGFQGAIGSVLDDVTAAPGRVLDFVNTKQSAIDEAARRMAFQEEKRKNDEREAALRKYAAEKKDMNIPQGNFRPLPPAAAPAPQVDLELQREYSPAQMSTTSDQDTADARNRTQIDQPEPSADDYALRQERKLSRGQVESLGEGQQPFQEGPEPFQVNADQQEWDSKLANAKFESKLGSGLAKVGRGLLGQTGVDTSKYELPEETSDTEKTMSDQFSPKERADLSNKFGVDVPVGMSVSRFKEIFPEIAKAMGMSERNALMAANTEANMAARQESNALRAEAAQQRQEMASMRQDLDERRFAEQQRASGVKEGLASESLQNRKTNTAISKARYEQLEAGPAQKLHDIETSEGAYVNVLAALDSGALDDAFGPVTSRLTKFKRYFGIAHPESVGAAAEVARTLALELKKYSGATVSDREMQRWTSIIGTAADTPAALRQLLEQGLNNTRREKQLFLTAQAGRGKNVSVYNQRSPQAIPQMGGPKQYMVRDPNDGSMVVMPLSDEDAEKVRQAGGEVTPYME